MADEQKTPTSYYAFETVTVADSSIGLTAATFDQQRFALITLETAPVRFRLDGSAPTSTVGHLLEVGDILELDSNEQLVAVRFIRTTGVSGSISVSYGA